MPRKRKRLFSKLDIDYLRYRANDDNICKESRLFYVWPFDNVLGIWFPFDLPAGVSIQKLHDALDEFYGEDSPRILVSKTFLQENVDFFLTKLKQGCILVVQSDKAPDVIFNESYKGVTK